MCLDRHRVVPNARSAFSLHSSDPSQETEAAITDEARDCAVGRRESDRMLTGQNVEPSVVVHCSRRGAPHSELFLPPRSANFSAERMAEPAVSSSASAAGEGFPVEPSEYSLIEVVGEVRNEDGNSPVLRLCGKLSPSCHPESQESDSKCLWGWGRGREWTLGSRGSVWVIVLCLQGAFAKVYRATCTGKTEEVAVKIIQLDKVQTPIEVIQVRQPRAWVARRARSTDCSQNEVRAMAMCRHENVLPLLSCFVNDAELWLVSPLMDKGSAYHVLKQAGKLADPAVPDAPRIPEEAIRAVLLQTLEGLAYLHSQKQIHRDIKAGNILLNSKCEVKIGDFGVAGWMNDDLSREDGRRDTFVGTPCWMAPEVMEQTKGYNERADIWSLGITALELATGKAPYASLPPMQVLMQTLNHEPPSLQTYKDAGAAVPRLSADFVRFVRMCLTKDPSKRCVRAGPRTRWRHSLVCAQTVGSGPPQRAVHQGGQDGRSGRAVGIHPPCGSKVPELLVSDGCCGDGSRGRGNDGCRPRVCKRDDLGVLGGIGERCWNVQGPCRPRRDERRGDDGPPERHRGGGRPRRRGRGDAPRGPETRRLIALCTSAPCG
jgi:hypothetical protein